MKDEQENALCSKELYFILIFVFQGELLAIRIGGE
jgi:hypothetical protein